MLSNWQSKLTLSHLNVTVVQIRRERARAVIVSAASSIGPQTAHLTRILFTGIQPNQALRNVLTKRPPVPRGPMSAFVLFFSLLSLLYALYRKFIVSRTKQCTTCRGYGIERCTLCDGTGSIRWEAKWDHVEPCPRCMGRRFSSCSDCGGFHQRPLFAHLSRNAGLATMRANQRTETLEPLLD